jgi:hypothetical protein
MNAVTTMRLGLVIDHLNRLNLRAQFNRWVERHIVAEEPPTSEALAQSSAQAAIEHLQRLRWQAANDFLPAPAVAPRPQGTETMSWLSQLKNAVLTGLEGATAVTPTPDGTPIHTALIAIDTAANQASAAIKTAAVSTVDTAVASKVGPLGEAVADEFLNELIAYAATKLSPAAKAATPPLASAQG